MDLSFNAEDDQVLRLRQHPINIDELSPVIRLITVNSAEHVRLCLPSPYEIPSDRITLQGLVAATTLLRNFAGMEIKNDDTRYAQVAEFIRSHGQKETDVFGIRDIEGYMAGHRGLAGLALKRARPATDDDGDDRKRFEKPITLWQVVPLYPRSKDSNLQWFPSNVRMMNFTNPSHELRKPLKLFATR